MTRSKLRTRGSRPTFNLEALVLFSLSPEALLEASNRSSNGRAVAVNRPLQLILFGTEGISKGWARRRSTTANDEDDRGR